MRVDRRGVGVHGALAGDGVTPPLTKEERDGIGRFGITHGEMYERLADYEETVRAVEAERDAASARAEKLREALKWVTKVHGADAWAVESCRGFAIAALAADDAEAES